MSGREDKKTNDLFYLCSLIVYISRKTLNKPKIVVKKLGRENLEKIYELADVYHCDNIDDVSDSFIEKCKIEKGDFDNIKNCLYTVPTHWDMGKVYKRIVILFAQQKEIDYISALIEIFSLPLIDKVENYNSDLYYQSRETILEFLTE